MTRCIHCTRCVRFFQDVAGIEEFGTTLRGQETEIGSYIGKSLNSELSGNIIDLCPVGALTSKPYAFTARPWEIKSVESVDIMDSVGSSIKINFKETELLRILPLPLENLNEEWISDKTRFFFDSLKTQRLGQCFKKVQVMGQFKKISWKSLLDEKLENMAEFSQLQAEEVLFVCGNNLDLKTIYLLKEISQISGVSLITESFNEVDLTLMPNFKLNTTFEDILSSDSCLTLGSNVRFEASLLNVRLKKRVNIGGFSKASIGLCDNFTYSNDSIGNSFRIFVSLVEGRHIFCKTLVKAKAPFLILGTSVKKRLDSNVSTLLLSYLSQNTNLLKKDWFGINFLSTTSSHFGESFWGIKSHNKSCLDSRKFIYCVGVEFFENLFSKIAKDDNFIVVNSAFANPLLKKADLILPSTIFVEKEEFFLNVEGRVQKTNIGLSGPSVARDDSNILKILFPQSTILKQAQCFKSVKASQINSEYSYQVFSSAFFGTSNFRALNNEVIENPAKIFLNINENKNSFTKPLFSNKKVYLKKIYKTSFKVVLPNFFSSNIFTKFSLTLSKCGAIFSKSYSNFI